MTPLFRPAALVLSLALVGLPLVVSQSASAAPSAVAAALADPARPARDRAADTVRLPAATLAFAGVKPGMTVIEFAPGGGYFTRLLSDVVGPEGSVIGVENKDWDEAVRDDRALASQPGRSNVEIIAEPFGQLHLPRPADLFWISQNYHDLKVAEFGPVDVAAFNRKVFQALKPGGIYVIVDHQANPGVTPAEINHLHRVEKATVIREVTAAGFRLADEATFLRRAGDDHTRPIFDAAIKGRTDQFALKFIKPAS